MAGPAAVEGEGGSSCGVAFGLLAVDFHAVVLAGKSFRDGINVVAHKNLHSVCLETLCFKHSTFKNERKENNYEKKQNLHKK
jgi:hypothetical protein